MGRQKSRVPRKPKNSFADKFCELSDALWEKIKEYPPYRIRKDGYFYDDAFRTIGDELAGAMRAHAPHLTSRQISVVLSQIHKGFRPDAIVAWGPKEWVENSPKVTGKELSELMPAIFAGCRAICDFHVIDIDSDPMKRWSWSKPTAPPVASSPPS